jgi:hypothetical protein
MVLHTSGYSLYFDKPFRSELTFLLGSNQIAVEQRFFAQSRPEPADWSALTIWQAATDHHRIVAALTSIYVGRWLSTGESKGGMASVYHRRFYPSDVDGTVAYVAPNDVVDDVDVYTEFLDNAGPSPACRAALKETQRDALRRRGDLVAMYAAWAKANGRTFDRTIGTADRAFEMLVLDLPFAFWQLKSSGYCRNVPPVGGPVDDLYRFLNLIAGVDNYTDQGLDGYVPYYYQAATQLGYPSLSTPHLDGLLRYPGLYAACSYVPRDIPTSFDAAAMADVDDWVRTAGSRLMFVYGQYDPWSAEPFRLGSGSTDSYWFEVAAGNHNADLGDLPAAQRSTATATISRWAGVSGAATTARAASGARAGALVDWKRQRLMGRPGPAGPG